MMISLPQLERAQLVCYSTGPLAFLVPKMDSFPQAPVFGFAGAPKTVLDTRRGLA